MRVAVIGCGSIGTRHAKNLKALGYRPRLHDADWHKTAVIADEVGGIALSDWELKMFCDPSSPSAIEAALICTPASTHTAVARELLAAGYRGPLFVEKPLAISTSSSDMEVFQSWPHPTVMVGYNWRWNADVVAWQHAWGDVPSRLVFHCDTNMAEWPGLGYATPLLECSHEIDLLHAMLGPSLRLTRDSRMGSSGMELDFVNEDIITATIDLAWAARKSVRRLIAKVGDRTVHESPTQASIDQSYVTELQHFLDAAARGATPDCSVDDGLWVLRTVEQALGCVREVA